MATTTISLLPSGKTTTAFGWQEWLYSAMSGDMATPMGESEGEARVNELTLN